MTRKAGQFGLIGFLLLWFGLIVPGHQRGVLRLPGSDAKPSCCAKVGSMTVQRDGNPPDGEPTRSPFAPAGKCAICQFTLTLDAPPPPTLFTPQSQPAEVLPVERTGRTWVEPTLDAWRQRGPPA